MVYALIIYLYSDNHLENVLDLIEFQVVQRMVLPILNHFIVQGLLIGTNVQSPFGTFLCIPLVLDMFLSILASYPFLILSLMDLFSRCQVFHKKTL